MRREDIIALKEFIHDELKQSKHWTKRIKRLTMYKNNQPIRKNYNNKLK